ncbi:nitrogenase component 1 [Clostridioides sp. ES-S-0190-01]|uniref:nitrogenase component 1 n=1 Tax=Clostridioides sp. ES-S-0190-01 TaxID=2770787 RepID=UPI001D12A1B2|nr:nitrogenase component 1 [Clostridioides sp. ES-S-0190-01]
MEVYKYFPNPSDRMGIIFTVSSISEACVIEFGPSGTTHYAIEAIGSLNGEDKAKIYSTHMSESDVTFGNYDRLEKAIIEIDNNINPKYIFVMASSVSSIIGVDIVGICNIISDSVNCKLIPITTGGLREDYNQGVEDFLYILAKDVVKESNEKIDSFNIIGCNIDQYNFLSDCEEIKRMIKTFFKKEVNVTFTSYTSIDEIENASKSSLNIVLRKEGIKAATFMKDKYNIPYVYKKPYGIKNTEEFIKDIQKVTMWDLDKSAYEDEVSNIKRQVFNIKRKFYFYKESKKCAVFGDYDTALGFKDLLNELGLEVDRVNILHNTDCNDESVYIGNNELERNKYLKENELLVLFGDGTSIDMSHNSKLDIQISNPNLKSVNIYPYTPFIGLRGVLYIIERILNISL